MWFTTHTGAAWPTLTSQPQKMRTQDSTQTLLFAHSCKHVISRSKVRISNNAHRFEAVNKARESRYLHGFTEVVVIDAVQQCLFSTRAGSFYRAIMASTGRRLGSLDVPKSLSAAIILHKTSRKDNPRHLHPHLSTHIHITKDACVRVFICIVWVLLATGEAETFHKIILDGNTISFCLKFWVA